MIAVGIRVNTRDARAALAKLLSADGSGLREPANYLRIVAEDLVPVDTRALLLSIRVVPIKSRGKVMGYSIIAGDDRVIDYASYQERGTRKMSARPYMAPALVKTMPKIKAWRPGIPGLRE